MNQDWAALEELAVDVATSAAELIRTQRPPDLAVATKTSRTDVVTVMDQRAQDHLLDRLRVARPHDGIEGEEDGRVAGSSGLTWVVDPIDGTANYLYGLPMYAVSVALVEGDPAIPGRWRPMVGAVVNGATSDTFRAHRGGGARRVRPGGVVSTLHGSTADELGLALVATGFGYEAHVRARQAELLCALLPEVRDIRRYGSAALDLCLLAAGEVDAYFESGLNPWDFAAGWLVATEAGCVVGGPAAGSDPQQALTWAAGSSLAPAFGARVRELGARHTHDLWRRPRD